MGKLTQNFDLIAIVVLAFVLGVAQAPVKRAKFIGLEQTDKHFRILHVAAMDRLNSLMCR